MRSAKVVISRQYVSVYLCCGSIINMINMRRQLGPRITLPFWLLRVFTFLALFKVFCVDFCFFFCQPLVFDDRRHGNSGSLLSFCSKNSLADTVCWITLRIFAIQKNVFFFNGTAEEHRHWELTATSIARVDFFYVILVGWFYLQVRLLSYIFSINYDISAARCGIDLKYGPIGSLAQFTECQQTFWVILMTH